MSAIRAAVLLVVLAAGAGALVWVLSPLGGPEAITVSVDGARREVAADSTLASLALTPETGDLLDVEGDVLQAGLYAGAILLDGVAVPGSAVLHEGDAIRVVHGRDRREATVREIVPVAGGVPANPQFDLSMAPGEQIVRRGAQSHKLVSSTFRATGEARTPRAVALTFDDGPWPNTTAKVLQILERMRARATFFTIGAQVERYPQLVRRQLRAGMTVGNHTYSHPYSPPFDRQPPKRIRQEIEGGARALASLGVDTVLFRPPGGASSERVVSIAGELGQRVVLWTIDPKDWRAGTTAKQISRRVLRAVAPGSIVLLHDGGGNRSATIKALPEIIRGIRRKGLHLALVEPT